VQQNNKIQKLLGITAATDKDHWSQYDRGTLKVLGAALEFKLCEEEKPSELLHHLSDVGFFAKFIPELEDLNKVPQHKQNSSNAFHHSLVVCNNVVRKPMMRWAALFHDIGKSRFKTRADGSLDFRNHEYEGSEITRNILKRFKVRGAGNICTLIRFHSHPLDYQRQPNWKITTVKRFCEKHGELALPLIDLAIADKIASSSQSAYLEPLYNLRIMVEEITDER